MRPTRSAAVLFSFAIAVSPVYALTGNVSTTENHPIPYAFVALLKADYSTAGSGATDASGVFTINSDAKVDDGILVVQPPPKDTPSGYTTYDAQPRMYRFHGEPKLDIKLPPAGCIVVVAYDQKGALMRWDDFRKRGTFAEQFLYATDAEDQAIPAVCWPVFDAVAKAKGQPRELGIPALAVQPGTVPAANVLFWDTAGYGKLHLRADNGGKGFTIAKPGDAIIVELNVELARTSVAALNRPQFVAVPEVDAINKAFASVASLGTPARRAAAADKVLADALRLRDKLEVDAARKAIPSVRQGTAKITVNGKDGKPAANCTVHLTPKKQDFLFGVFEGGKGRMASFQAAHDAGFNFATLLLGWKWTESPGGGIDTATIDQAYGIAPLIKLGYTLKAHGVVWLQGYGIMPDRASSMPPEQLRDAELKHESALLDAFNGRIGVWEAINEPNLTNVVKMPASMVSELFQKSATAIKGHKDALALVNGGHEGDYGSKFAMYALDNSPANHGASTYSLYIEQTAGALDNVDVVGLQYYPGHHFNERFGNLEAPATTPSWLVDTITRYSRFRRPIHISEFSVPSTYGADWKAGYWREPWTEKTQADYAEMVFTLAYGNRFVSSITWWDISDSESSVISGGLRTSDGRDKPAFTRLKELLAQWKPKPADAKTDATGVASFTGVAGDYDIAATTAGGATAKGEIHIPERNTVSVALPAGAGG